jgi:hypothetical protein
MGKPYEIYGMFYDGVTQRNERKWLSSDIRGI